MTAERLEDLGAYLVLVPSFVLLGWALAELGYYLTGYSEGLRGIGVFALPGAYAAHRVNVARRVRGG